jgi:hypothetical protein
MTTVEPGLTDPASLLAIARAARLIGDLDLEEVACRLLRDEHDIEILFHFPRRKRSRPGALPEEVDRAD